MRTQSDPVFDTTHLQNFIRLPDNQLLPIFEDVVEGRILAKVKDYLEACPEELAKKRIVTPHPRSQAERLPLPLLFKYLNDLAA